MARRADSSEVRFDARRCGEVGGGVHNSDDVDPRRIRELTDSMMHAPRVVPIAKRFELDDTILVISHAEIWRWRIIVRGTRASREAPTPLTVPVVPDGNEGDSSGLTLEHDARTGRHEAHRWLTEWHREYPWVLAG
jgi:hypothetical protein